MTPSQFRQALETLAFTDGSRMAVQLASGDYWRPFPDHSDQRGYGLVRRRAWRRERQWLIDVTQIAAVAEPWRGRRRTGKQ